MPAEFSVWHEPDLLRFLQVLGDRCLRDGDASGVDVQHSLDLDTDTALAATRQLVTLGCITESGRPRRLSDGVLETGRVLTALGVTALLDGRVPRA